MFDLKFYNLINKTVEAITKDLNVELPSIHQNILNKRTNKNTTQYITKNIDIETHKFKEIAEYVISHIDYFNKRDKLDKRYNFELNNYTINPQFCRIAKNN